jgi:hypothetical protein
MSKDKTFRVGVMNIVIHPHTHQKYVELWRTTFRARRSVELRSKFKALIGSHHPINSSDHLQGIEGEIYKFFDLDPNGAWYDLDSAKAANQDDLNQIKIPAKLKPDLALFNYVFLPKVHKLVYEAKTSDGKGLSPGSMEKVLSNLFSTPQIQQTFGKVEVTAVPQKDSLLKILKMHRLSSLTIDLRKPNPDDFDQIEKEIMDRLQNMKARRIVEKVIAERGETLKPDAEIRGLAEVAKSNGKVIAEGSDVDGTRVVKSTTTMPLVEATSYDPGNTDAKSALREKAYEMTGN